MRIHYNHDARQNLERLHDLRQFTRDANDAAQHARDIVKS
jgi:hypothetical protein